MALLDADRVLFDRAWPWGAVADAAPPVGSVNGTAFGPANDSVNGSANGSAGGGSTNGSVHGREAPTEPREQVGNRTNGRHLATGPDPQDIRPEAATAEPHAHDDGAVDPWATGRWPVEPVAGLPAPSGPSEPAAVDHDPLRSALADLDRIWGRVVAEEENTPPAGAPVATAEPEPETCTVVIDVARSGRRFAGRRATVVVREAGDRLAGRLPQGAELVDDGRAGLSVVAPGWDEVSATSWMNRVVPGLLDDFQADNDLAGLDLRAVVVSAGGVVGAQALQPLDELPGAGADRAGGGPTGRHVAPEPTPFEVLESVRPGSGGRRRRPSDTLAPSDGVRAIRPSSERHNTDPPQAGAGTGRSGRPPADDEALGLADLLAGALAAYRRI